MLPSELQLHGRPVDSVFQLLGDKENDLSYSLGWGLAQSPRLLHGFIRTVTGQSVPADECTVRLQQHGNDRGYTDIEIEAGNVFCIVEAKRGWKLPSNAQMKRYLPRFRGERKRKNYLVSLSQCTREFAQSHLRSSLGGIPLRHVSWADVIKLTELQRSKENHSGKRLLSELAHYLRKVMRPSSSKTNEVFVVSLSNAQPAGWKISWIDVIRKRRLYFFPFNRKGWPKEPPNYVAFRYYGKLQAIHHVQSYKRVSDMHDMIREIPRGEISDHFLCNLGPGFSPGHEVRTGAIYPSGRVWCFLDTLFTSKTISEARTRSAAREE
jgi:hypothetical protein